MATSPSGGHAVVSWPQTTRAGMFFFFSLYRADVFDSHRQSVRLSQSVSEKHHHFVSLIKITLFSHSRRNEHDCRECLRLLASRCLSAIDLVKLFRFSRVRSCLSSWVVFLERWLPASCRPTVKVKSLAPPRAINPPHLLLLLQQQQQRHRRRSDVKVVVGVWGGTVRDLLVLDVRLGEDQPTDLVPGAAHRVQTRLPELLDGGEVDLPAPEAGAHTPHLLWEENTVTYH